MRNSICIVPLICTVAWDYVGTPLQALSQQLPASLPQEWVAACSLSCDTPALRMAESGFEEVQSIWAKLQDGCDCWMRVAIGVSKGVALQQQRSLHVGSRFKSVQGMLR